VDGNTNQFSDSNNTETVKLNTFSSTMSFTLTSLLKHYWLVAGMASGWQTCGGGPNLTHHIQGEIIRITWNIIQFYHIPSSSSSSFFVFLCLLRPREADFLPGDCFVLKLHHSMFTCGLTEKHFTRLSKPQLSSALETPYNMHHLSASYIPQTDSIYHSRSSSPMLPYNTTCVYLMNSL